jgi:hypothetical protein
LLVLRFLKIHNLVEQEDLVVEDQELQKMEEHLYQDSQEQQTLVEVEVQDIMVV